MPQAPWAASAVEARAVASLLPYAGNARTHSPEQVAQIAASILEFGFVAPVLVDERGELIAGHGRLLAAQSLGLDTVPTIVRAGLTEAQKAAYRLADNRIALNAGWDEALLQAELDALPKAPYAAVPAGPATVETYTVMHDRKGPSYAILFARDAEGRRLQNARKTVLQRQRRTRSGRDRVDRREGRPIRPGSRGPSGLPRPLRASPHPPVEDPDLVGRRAEPSGGIEYDDLQDVLVNTRAAAGGDEQGEEGDRRGNPALERAPRGPGRTERHGEHDGE